MSERVQGEIEAAVLRGGEQDRFQAETEVKLSRGQTPTIDANVYEPKEVRDAGYPLSNPTTQPNNHTKEGTRYYAGRDSHDGTSLKPVTNIQDPVTRLPQSVTYMTRSDAIFAKLESAKSDVDTEMGLTNIYKQFIDYTNSLSDDDPTMAYEQANRLKWNTIDRLESTGFGHLSRSEYTEEGLDDTGMNGLQMIFAAGLFQGKAYEQIIQDIGDTGANDAQLEEAYDRAMQGNERAQYNVINELPKTNEEAMADPRYIGAIMQILQAENPDKDYSGMTAKELLEKGKMQADMLKSNLLAMPAVAATIAQNPDSAIAEAYTFLLQTDENLPFEGMDVFRHTLAMAADPTTYIGGYGIWSKLLTKGGAAGAVLKKLGIGATMGAGMGAGYGALYDIGMQNIDIAARNQEGFDPARLGQMALLGGTLGYVLGGAIGLAPKAKGLISDMYSRMKADKPSALDDFGADIIPESELKVRRQLREFMEEDKLRKMADDEVMQKEFIELANEATEMEEKRLTLIKGGATEADPSHAAQMEVIEGGKGESISDLQKFHQEMRTDVQNRVLAKAKEVEEHVAAGDFRFKIGDTVKSKHSGKEFEIHHLKWDEKTGEAQYFVTGPEGEKHYMSEWGMVGGKPKMELVNGVPLEDFPE